MPVPLLSRLEKMGHAPSSSCSLWSRVLEAGYSPLHMASMLTANTSDILCQGKSWQNQPDGAHIHSVSIRKYSNWKYMNSTKWALSQFVCTWQGGGLFRLVLPASGAGIPYGMWKSWKALSKAAHSHYLLHSWGGGAFKTSLDFFSHEIFHVLIIFVVTMDCPHF